MDDMKRISRFLLLFLMACSCALAQEESIDTNAIRPRYGAYFNFNMNDHFADFDTLPGIPSCCPKYEEGFGTGVAFGLLYEFPLEYDLLLGFRAGYASYSGELKKIENEMVMVDGDLYPGKFEHTLDAKLTNIGIEPMLSWNFTRRFFLHGGFRIAYTTTNTYEQLESIVDPETRGFFVDENDISTGKRERGFSEGNLEDAVKLQAAFKIGLSYDLAVNHDKTLFITPEVFYAFGISPVVSNLSWHANNFSIGLSMRYSPIPEIPIIDEFKEVERIDTVFVKEYNLEEEKIVLGVGRIESDTLMTAPYRRLITNKLYRTDTLFTNISYELNASITAVGVDSLGNEIPNPVFKIEEFLTTKMHPLLNYVFFDDNSAVLPKRYKLLSNLEAEHFANYKLKGLGTIDIYYNVLNIVGARMRDYPEATLTIVGCNSDQGDEEKNIGLSKQRAEIVRDYLMEIWELPESSIQIKVRNLPEQYSTPTDQPKKIEENRRVELYSDEFEIMKYVMVTDTLRTVNPPVIRFKPEVSAEAGLKLWDIKVVQDNKILKDFSTSGYVLPKVDMNVDPHDWNMDNDKYVLPEILKNMEYRLHVIDNKYQDFKTAYQTIPVKLITIQKKRENRIMDKVIDRFSLILFDFDKAAIQDKNIQIADLIKGKITENSEVKIEGFTDQTGDDMYNRKLSLDRARATSKALGHPPKTTVEGIGEGILLYGNDLPEGRFYCRTVNVTVETLVSPEQAENPSIE